MVSWAEVSRGLLYFISYSQNKSIPKLGHLSFLTALNLKEKSGVGMTNRRKGKFSKLGRF